VWNGILQICRPVMLANKSSAVAETGDHLATIDMGRKVGGGQELLWEGAGSPLGHHLTQCGLGQGLFCYQVAS